MLRKHHSRTNLVVESLEDRLLMAGNVTASVELDMWGSKAVLAVEGDNQANQIRIVEDIPGTVLIEGVDGTTVNGKAADELFSETPDFTFLKVNLGNGDDTLAYEFSGWVRFHITRIETGNGDDTVTVLAQDQASFVEIDTGNGNDNVTYDMAAGSSIAGFNVMTGAGHDSVLVRADGDGGDQPYFDTQPLIMTEQGNDSVRFEGNFDASSDLWVWLGAGDDLLIGDPEGIPDNDVTVYGGEGEDTVLNSSYFLYGIGPCQLYDFESIDDE